MKTLNQAPTGLRIQRSTVGIPSTARFSRDLFIPLSDANTGEELRCPVKAIAS